jgi:lipopolysaccharide biosynthesis protein
MRKISIFNPSMDHMFNLTVEGSSVSCFYGGARIFGEVIDEGGGSITIMWLHHPEKRIERYGASPNGYFVKEDDLLSARERYVERLDKEASLFSGGPRTVAFYLPQYHAIRENDLWWGEGFTDWRNVSAARPLFRGHDQPHVPGELGEYDLSDVEAIRRQSSLAKAYGVDAFCFYFYWFDGKTLLERPIELFAGDRSIETGFCLCWANENWTRSWDGKEDEILIRQEHSREDDLKFIAHVARYLKDPRYLRVDGKPVLLVYRASLLPDPSSTASAWREWCSNNGVGDIHLVCTQSFECRDPKEYGFDAACEFSPNIPVGHKGSVPALVNEHAKDLAPGFRGKIFDWTSYVKRSRNFPDFGYPLYRCANPGWDNTPRRGVDGNLFVGSSPRGFQEWMFNALGDAESNYGSEGLVFVNAWNEWAEGAHLEPDQRRGFANLEAVRNARARRRCVASAGSKPFAPGEVATVFHAFYPDLMEEALDLWSSAARLNDTWFIVTAPPDKAEECERILGRKGPARRSVLLRTENRGRDVVPFFKAFDLLLRLGVRAVCKLHSKKSPHRADGDKWRRELFASLLNPESVGPVLDELAAGGTGVVCPGKYKYGIFEYSMNFNYGNVFRLSERIGVGTEGLSAGVFPAGSMFWARTDALVPLHMIYGEGMFEEERGQLDDAMVHAFERMFSLSALSVGMGTTDVEACGEGDRWTC